MGMSQPTWDLNTGHTVKYKDLSDCDRLNQHSVKLFDKGLNVTHVYLYATVVKLLYNGNC